MKLVTKENIPGRREFKSRFNRKLGATAGLFEPISEQLAEEAEKVIYEAWRGISAPIPVEDPVVYVNRINLARRTRHYCSDCGKQCIYPGHNYCPSCGTKIVWTN
jgi:predicted RNA-binding Zn-ribbon protein involved in translation (DUF1610 family)